jgi:hypothetical protein
MEIYAEISYKILEDIEEFGRELLLPSGVSMYRRKGSRACHLTFDKPDRQNVIDFLEDRRISWQDIPEEKENKKEHKEDWAKSKEWMKPKEWEKPAKNKSGFRDFTDPWLQSD